MEVILTAAVAADEDVATSGDSSAPSSSSFFTETAGASGDSSSPSSSFFTLIIAGINEDASDDAVDDAVPGIRFVVMVVDAGE